MTDFLLFIRNLRVTVRLDRIYFISINSGGGNVHYIKGCKYITNKQP